MGFFSDLKEDLSQAVNELMPEEELDQAAVEETKEQPVENTQETTEETPMEPQAEETPNDNAALEEMLKNLDSIEIPQEKEEQPEEETTAEESRIEEAPIGEAVPELDLDSILQNDMTVDSVLKQENTENSKGAEKRMDAKIASDETAVITAGMVITGDVSSVVIGNITAISAAIAGAVKGDIDVQGPVVLDSSAIVMGNIKSKSVQINNGAVIEGMCSQCYADVSPTSFFDDYKPEKKKVK